MNCVGFGFSAAGTVIGLPLTLFRQAGLILGLVLQPETLWQTNRATTQTLSALSTNLAVPLHAFYMHLAEGASPHLLLADLKGQLDQLSDQMSKRR